MKLVEILAQELEEWPETTHWYAQDGNGLIYPWIKEPMFFGDEWAIGSIDPSVDALDCSANLASDYVTTIVTKDMWEAEKNKLCGNGNAEWREGIDLPPVGVECERAFDSPLKWEVVKILAHTELLEQGVAIFQLGEEFGYSSADKFRKIISKKRERENYIDRIYGVILKAERPNNRSDMAEALYDAGLRFVEE